MRISNIIWDVDMDDVYENLDEMTAEKAAEALGISQKRYANMSTAERHDYAYEVFHGHDAAIGEFMGLPTEMDVPDDIDTDEDSVGDYLSDKYGYCHRGFVVDSNKQDNDSATYEELATAYRKSGHAVFVMALNTLISLGRDTVANMKHPAAISATIQGNIFSEDFKVEVARLVLRMASADVDVLLAVIQRVVTFFTDLYGRRIPFLCPNGDEDGICPVCGSTLIEYLGDRDLDDAGTTVSWACSDCKAIGRSLYRDTFVQHDEVRDRNGNKVSPRV